MIQDFILEHPKKIIAIIAACVFLILKFIEHTPKFNIAQIEKLIAQKRYEKALRIAKVAANNGEKEAQYILAGIYIRIQQERESFHWLCQAAESGHAKAQYELAMIYKTGSSFTKPDTQHYNYWLKKAAEQDYAPANELLKEETKIDSIKRPLILGAVCGDVIGSIHENSFVKSIDFPLFTKGIMRFTDDTVLTVATMDCLLNEKDYCRYYREYGNFYKGRGYGYLFRQWIASSTPEPYNSFGNGSGMRVSPIGWVYDSLEDTLAEAKRSAIVTHNHPEGIKGAQAIAAAVFLARTGESKEKIREYISSAFGYNLQRTIEEIRPDYYMVGNATCQGSVPESIIAFLDSTDYEHAIRLAISIGGDSDTIACMAGSIAEAFYGGVPTEITNQIIRLLPDQMLNVIEAFSDRFWRNR